MKTFFIKTFGCQANKSDSERIVADYLARGFKQVYSWKKADEIVVNTCSVRQRVEDRVAGLLLNIDKHAPKKHKIILTGCMLHYGEKTLRKKLPQINKVLPINQLGFNAPSVRTDKNHAWVPISSGCNSFCTYCIVPYSRGREISRPQRDILVEVKNLLENGYSEITLLGQNVNSYGLEDIDINTRKSNFNKPKFIPPFVKLIQELSKFEKLKQINFITANPWDFWDELITEIARNKKINRYIHLPFQSGSDKILKLMNRGYTGNDYLRLVEKIKDKVPDVVFGTDIIVGFPNETDKDFQDTVNLAKKVNFKVAFIAQYSPRPGTVASRIYSDNISPQIKKKRWQILEDLINKPNLKTRPLIQ